MIRSTDDDDIVDCHNLSLGAGEAGGGGVDGPAKSGWLLVG